MTRPEQDLLEAFLRRTSRYVEFGSGGSTVLASQLVADQVLSVDSSAEWLQRVQRACEEAATPIRPQLVMVDIGPIGDWGYPTDQNTKARWGVYHNDVWSAAQARNGEFYLIDGRFRVASFLQSLLHGPADALFALHDFNVRPQYEIVKEVAREVAAVEGLSIFVKGSNYRPSVARTLLAKFWANPE